MHSEHLTNLHPGWVVIGWLIAVAITSGVYLALVGSGLLLPGRGAILGIGVAIAVGFFAGGLFVGVRWSDAPILHGAAITFLSVAIWFLGSLALPGSFEAWSGPTPAVLGLILLQLVASVGGGWTGRRMMVGASGGEGAEDPVPGGEPMP
jgi:hypothetical protein